MGIPPARKLGPIKCEAKFHHLSRQITTIGKRTTCDLATMAISVSHFCSDLFTFAECHQFIFCGFTIRVAIFRCIDAEQPYLILTDNKGVAIDHVG